MEQLTKNDTILWINHAVTYFKGIGKTQKDMAKTLGIEESRVSEMKLGNGTISPNLMAAIVGCCGAPRRNPGRYEEVELYDDLDGFFNSFRSVTANRFHRKLLKLAKNDDFYHHFLDLVSTSNQHYKTDKSSIETLLNELLSSEEYLEICRKYSDIMRLNDKCSDGSREMFQLRDELFRCQSIDKPMWSPASKDGYRVLNIGGLQIEELEVFKMLFLYLKLIQWGVDFQFGEHATKNIQPEVSIEPVVLTGKRILIVKSHSLESAQVASGVYELFGKNKGHFQFSAYHKLGLKPEQYMPDYWEEARCELYLSENMNYHFLIHLSPTFILEHADIDEESQSDLAYFGDVRPDDRLIVIRNINSLSLYQQIEDVRKWFGLPSDSLLELKQEIAKAGGYVPGARVLL